MENIPSLRALCIYRRPLTPFKPFMVYEFVKYADYSSFSVYKPIGVDSCYATRLLDDSGAIVIEGTKGVVAVFEVC